MQKDTIFDESAQRKVLADVRLVLEDTVGIIERGKHTCPELLRLAETLADAYKYHELLLDEMVIRETIEGSARKANEKLLLKIGALERELFFACGALEQERKTSKKFIEVVLNNPYIMRQGGPTSS